MLFKVCIKRKFARPFKFYVPTESELRDAQIDVQAGYIERNRIENCVGHPTLHEALHTPVLDDNMMPLLAQVYSGRLDSEQTTMRVCSEQQTEVCVLPGGIQIAGIDQSDLEYDPALYQRDRGELDWDQRSIATALDSTANFSAGGRNSPAPSLPGYNRYLNQGPGVDSDIELVRFDADQQPLLPPTLIPGPGKSSQSLPGYSSPQPPNATPGITQYPPPAGAAYYGRVTSNDGYREAPTHRPYSRQEPSRSSPNSGRDSPGPTGGWGVNR